MLRLQPEEYNATLHLKMQVTGVWVRVQDEILAASFTRKLEKVLFGIFKSTDLSSTTYDETAHCTKYRRRGIKSCFVIYPFID